MSLCRSLTLLLVVLAVATCASGCQPKLIPVEGIVTLDGKPVVDAAVMFVASEGGRPATGVTDKQGRYHLTTFDQLDGCVPGKHAVSVTLNKIEGSAGTMTPEGAVSGSGLIKTTWLVPEKYSNPATSGLSAEVNRQATVHNFALVSQPESD